jgi:hypothetical protein
MEISRSYESKIRELLDNDRFAHFETVHKLKPPPDSTSSITGEIGVENIWYNTGITRRAAERKRGEPQCGAR